MKKMQTKTVEYILECYSNAELGLMALAVLVIGILLGWWLKSIFSFETLRKKHYDQVKYAEKMHTEVYAKPTPEQIWGKSRPNPVERLKFSDLMKWNVLVQIYNNLQMKSSHTSVWDPEDNMPRISTGEGSGKGMYVTKWAKHYLLVVLPISVQPFLSTILDTLSAQEQAQESEWWAISDKQFTIFLNHCRENQVPYDHYDNFI